MTINPGVVIKYQSNNACISVRGALNIAGTSSNKVIFTQGSDDSAGGDSNNNGNGSTPGNDLFGITFEDESDDTQNSINYLDMRFAGGYRYYREALSKLPDLPVIIFSDDHDWCKQQELFSSDRFAVSEDNTADADLCLMSLCKYHIIANSSFSWWGAWLAKSEKVIAPQNWFGGDCSKNNTKDLYLPDWVIL